MKSKIKSKTVKKRNNNKKETNKKIAIIKNVKPKINLLKELFIDIPTEKKILNCIWVGMFIFSIFLYLILNELVNINKSIRLIAKIEKSKYVLQISEETLKNNSKTLNYINQNLK